MLVEAVVLTCCRLASPALISSIADRVFADSSHTALCCRSVWWRETFPKYSEGQKKSIYRAIWGKIKAGKLSLDKHGKPSD